jgi:hypothetical protein
MGRDFAVEILLGAPAPEEGDHAKKCAPHRVFRRVRLQADLRAWGPPSGGPATVRLKPDTTYYSVCNATNGLTRVARRVGPYAAASAATMNSIAAKANVAGSSGVTPNNRLSR